MLEFLNLIQFNVIKNQHNSSLDLNFSNLRNINCCQAEDFVVLYNTFHPSISVEFMLSDNYVNSIDYDDLVHDCKAAECN